MRLRIRLTQYFNSVRLCRLVAVATIPGERELRPYLKKERSRLIPKVRAIHQQTRGSYGARRISEELRAEGESCGRTKATTLMNLAGVKAKQKKKYKVTTNSKHNLPVAPNLLELNFYVSEPDCVYCSDITYIWTTEGWLYHAITLDSFSLRVVGWSLGDRIKKELVMKA